MGFNNQFTVPYLTPRGKVIKLPVPDLPDSEELHALMLNVEARPEWAQAYLDEVYAEYRQQDNRRRSDVSADAVGAAGADYFAAPVPQFIDQIHDEEIIIELLSSLTATQCEYIELHVLHDYRFTEIAADTAAAGQPTSADAVRKVVSRALARLRQSSPHLRPSGFDAPHA